MQPDLDLLKAICRDLTPGRKKLELLYTTSVLVKHIDSPAPCLLLRVVDFSEVKDGLLNHSIASNAAGFNNGPVMMELTVLLAFGAAQKHDSSA